MANFCKTIRMIGVLLSVIWVHDSDLQAKSSAKPLKMQHQIVQGVGQWKNALGFYFPTNSDAGSFVQLFDLNTFKLAKFYNVTDEGKKEIAEIVPLSKGKSQKLYSLGSGQVSQMLIGGSQPTPSNTWPAFEIVEGVGDYKGDWLGIYVGGGVVMFNFTTSQIFQLYSGIEEKGKGKPFAKIVNSGKKLYMLKSAAPMIHILTVKC